MAGGAESKKAEILAKLKGKDFSGLLNNPQRADVNELREAVLYNFNMLVYEDPDFTLGVVKILTEKGGEEGPKEIKRQGLKPDFNKHRGAIRSVFDGRYKFNRYFSTLQHNQPKTYEELTAVNDLELFDHKSDPHEMVNIAADPAKNKKLVTAMNAKLNAIIKDEVGVDDGSSMGLKQDREFAFTKVDI